MEGFPPNSSLIFISHRSSNWSEGETTYEQCQDMPGVLIWYLSLQFTNMLLGIPTNLMVLWLIHKNKEDSSTSDIFISQLAVLDVLFCLIPPLELVSLVFFNHSTSWYVLRFFYGIKDFSPLFLSCICLDRYMAVIHPVIFTKLRDHDYRSALAVVVWIIILAYASIKCLGNVPNFDKVFTAMILIVFTFMVMCNITIMWALKQSGPNRDEMHPVKKRAFKMVLIILAIILFNYLPAVALFPFQKYFSPGVFKCYIHYIAFGLMDFSSSIQPILYLSKETLRWRHTCCPNRETQTS
ncbi:uracil nucleotide/cysteinyl leukotriene receptor [Oryzias melastigma]|uniref:uracil nucleotide/cysteinyl leukotriene receptor n=1 Tax=Oryzias melastigma TaxID=30732 RepID=UPI000CF83610|nr:uracil nucleotide/cysteinyl leukotriene receptor [Oryzias melastigma]